MPRGKLRVSCQGVSCCWLFHRPKSSCVCQRVRVGEFLQLPHHVFPGPILAYFPDRALLDDPQGGSSTLAGKCGLAGCWLTFPGDGALAWKLELCPTRPNESKNKRNFKIAIKNFDPFFCPCFPNQNIRHHHWNFWLEKG